jgi:hypothetical protein
MATHRSRVMGVNVLYTLQVLPSGLQAVGGATDIPHREGLLPVVARGATMMRGLMPWPLTRLDLLPIREAREDLVEVSFEDVIDDEDPPVRRFRVESRHA